MASSLDALRSEVLGRPTCAACGACVGLCPYILAVDDNVASVGTCRIEGGRCYRFCPRTGADATPDATTGLVGPSGTEGPAGDAGRSGPVGRVAATYLARSIHPSGEGSDAESLGSIGSAGEAAGTPRPAQHGGAVSALVLQALRDGLVNAAVLTTESDAGSPRAVPAASEAEVEACRGSKFAVTPVVAEVNRALASGRGDLGVVVLPCQATAIARMRAAGRDLPLLPGAVTPAEGIALVVGLFCTWALEQEGWSRLARERLGPGPFRRVDIPPPPAEVLVAEDHTGATSEVPLADVRTLIRPGCRVCMDMTAEDADISVGMAETEAGWNTILVRTPVGEGVLSRAVSAGRLELRPTSAEGMAHLEAASLGKKRRAAAEAGARLAGASDSGVGAVQPERSPYLVRVAAWEGPS